MFDVFEVKAGLLDCH